MKTQITTWTAAILTTMVIAAAINSASAQRRPNQNKKAETRVEKKREIRNSAREKNAVKNYEVKRVSDNKPEVKRRSTHSAKNAQLKNSQAVHANKSGNRNIYRNNKNDQRYVPNKNFKGNKNYWSGNSVKHRVPYNKHDENYYRNYDYNKYLHWDRNWETYRWNANSWKDYYSAYHPYSYKFNKHYYYHPNFGHVIKKINGKPVYFVHNNVRYYNYNGHFFRYFKGVGYVLVDMPYGIVFRNMPAGYEIVYINGYRYFRSGNLFFEKHPHGFSLVHYPERYFALEVNFNNHGYYPNDYYYYN